MTPEMVANGLLTLEIAVNFPTFRPIWGFSKIMNHENLTFLSTFDKHSKPEHVIRLLGWRDATGVTDRLFAADTDVSRGTA